MHKCIYLLINIFEFHESHSWKQTQLIHFQVLTLQFSKAVLSKTLPLKGMQKCGASFFASHSVGIQPFSLRC
jgi:hypothetical protein